MTVSGMDWTYPTEAGDAGIFEIGRRLAVALGRGPDATRFTYDAREMLRATRQIEQVARGGRLLTGFQTAEKLRVEAHRYADLIAAGTDVTVWATGPRPEHAGLSSLDYRSISPDAARIQNQWFLVSDRPEPLAFVSYELGDPATFGIGGAATPGKQFVGFVSDDPGVVDLLIRAVLSPIAPPAARTSPLTGPDRGSPAGIRQAAPAAAAPSGAARELVELSRAAGPHAPSGAGSGAVVVAVGRGADRPAFLTALEIATRERRALVIVDRSAEGFSSPYTDLRGDDAGRPDANQLFGVDVARREGRGGTALYLEAAAVAGVTAGGWFPTHAGYGGLVDAARRFAGALYVLPPEAATPSLAERLRGVVPEKLRAGTGLPVVVAGAVVTAA